MTRVLAFVFTDLVDSAEILSRLGESRARGVHGAHFELLRGAAQETGGRELMTHRDGMLLAFDSPSDAVACAVAMQRRAARHNVRAAQRLDLRIGVSAGEARDGDEFHERGAALEAHRLCDAALGGQILVSSPVRALASAPGNASFSPVGLLELPGLPDPLAAFEVAYEQSAPERLPLPPELAAPGTQTHFVGRTGEHARLGRAWASVEGGQGQLALISGEPGIGKSRLASEFALRVYDTGATVLWGRCFEDALVPYEPFVQALRHYVATCDPEELRRRHAKLTALAKLLPELAAPVRTLEVPGDPIAAPESERHRLFEEIAALLAQIAADAPLLLVLDDLQWADQGTLLLLRNLLFDPRPASMLVLGTYRDSEVPRSHPLAQLYADVLRDRPVELIELTGLSEDEAATLVDSLLGWPLPTDVARTLCGETEGNPFFLEEVVRHIEELAAVSGAERMRTGDFAVDELGVPRRVKELVARRVQRLCPPAIELLHVASVVGSEFRLDLIATVLGWDEEQVVALLDEAIEARMLYELPGRLGEYGFTHALIHQALYQDLSANRRAALHHRIGEALEALTPDAASSLAHHFSLAGERSSAKVVRYGRTAGSRALELLAYEDAAREFGRALSALAFVDPGNASARAELLVLLGAAQRRAGQTAGAEAAFKEAAELARQAGAAITLAHAALGYGGGTGFGGVWTKFARVDALLVRFLEQALQAIPESEARLRVQLLARLAEALYWGPETERALALSAEALALARDIADPFACVHALDARHVALWQPDNLEELRPLADEMLRVGEDVGDREIQLQAYAWLITDALEYAPLHVVDGFIAAHARLADELLQPYHLWYTEVARAMRAHLEGRFTAMAGAMERAVHHGSTAHGETANGVYTVQMLHLKLDTGGIDDAIAVLEQFASESPLPATRSVLALAYAAAGRDAEGLALVDSFGGAEFREIRRDCVWSSTTCMLAEVVAQLDAAEYAPSLYGLLLPFADRNCVVGGAILCLGPVSRYLGMLARVNGDHDRALQHLRHALARSRALDSPPLVARAQVETAKALLAGGRGDDRAPAAELLAEARASAESLGMAQLVRDVDHLEAAPAGVHA